MPTGVDDPQMMIETNNLTKRFPCSMTGAGQPKTPPGPVGRAADNGSVGWLTAVDAVSLEVPAGQILALLGPNGAGKTTTVRMLAAILRPSDGWARVAGLDTVIARYTNCPTGGAVELWTIIGGSHGPTISTSFSPSVIDWLLAHPKP